MHTVIEPTIEKLEDIDAVYYTVRWSNLRKADKYDIVKMVPSVSGIFELYYMDDKKKLNLFFFSKAYTVVCVSRFGAAPMWNRNGIRFALKYSTITTSTTDIRLPVHIKICRTFFIFLPEPIVLTRQPKIRAVTTIFSSMRSQTIKSLRYNRQSAELRFFS